jgi:hypothetical protein
VLEQGQCQTINYITVPAWSAPKEKGKPKDNLHEKGVMDHIQESANNKCKRRKKMFCKICHLFNHDTATCYNSLTTKWVLAGTNNSLFAGSLHGNSTLILC